VFLRDGAARLADGTIAGSVSDLYTGMRNAVRFGIPEAEAIRAATIIPAREIGAEHAIGSVEPGKLADFVVCGEDLALQQVYIGGSPITSQIGKT
jgi:N-acetylglucosamine-6-phosphate deacetylase